MMPRLAAWALFSGLAWQSSAAKIPEATTDRMTVARLAASSTVLAQFREKAPETMRAFLDAALCIGVAPRRPQGGVGGGARGFMSCRASKGAVWSNPAAFLVEGGGVAWDVVGADFDLLVVATNQEAAVTLAGPRVLLSADVESEPGPTRPDQLLPRMNEYPTIFVWQKTDEGIMGIRIGGATITEDQTGNAALYGKVLGTAAVLRANRGERRGDAVGRFVAGLPPAATADASRKPVLAGAP
jgi:lipid-binding SYLF domain-containing protein